MISKTFRWLCLMATLFAAIPLMAESGDGGQFRVFGDLRLRGEADWDSSRSDGTERADRDRIRIRGRLGLEWARDLWTYTTRVRTGNTDGQQSPHITVLQSGDKGDRDLLFDRLVVRYGTSDQHLWVGRNGHPFWRRTEFLLDDDVYWDGVGGSLPLRGGRLAAMAAFVPEGEASLSLGDQGTLVGAQYRRAIGEGGRSTIAGTILHVADSEDEANPVLLDLDYTIAHLAYEWIATSRPFALGGELMFNLDEPSEGVFLRNERTGVIVWAAIGSLSNSGDWLGALYLAHVEKYAVVPFLAQDDWVRWGSATQTRSSNFEGVELRVAHALRSDLNVVARLYLVEAIELESAAATAKEDGKRARIDLNWRF